MMRYSSAVVGLGGVLASAAAHAAVFSDDFSVGQPSSTNTAASGFDSGTTLNTSYGARLLFTDNFANSDPGDARARTAVFNGHLTLSSDSEVAALGIVSFRFSTPVDFTTSPAIQFTILSNDEVGSILIDTGGNSPQTLTPLPIVPLGSPPVTVTVPIPLGTDLSSITQLDLGVGGQLGEDVSVDGVQAVSLPEPGFIAIAAVGAGLLLRRRRRLS